MRYFRLAKNNRSKSASTQIRCKLLKKQAVWPVIFRITGPICARAFNDVIPNVINAARASRLAGYARDPGSNPDVHIDDLAAQVGSVLADVFGTELDWRTVKILRQLHADAVRAWLRALRAPVA